MKFKATISVLVLTLLALPMIAFYLQFDSGNGLSQEQSDWVIFGTFYSGILNPIISSLAFIGAISAIYLQKNSIDQVSKQIMVQGDESRKNDIIREINSCSKTIEQFCYLTLEPREYVRLFDSIGFYDLPKNKELIIQKFGKFNDINKELSGYPIWVGTLISTIAHSDLTMSKPGSEHIKSTSKHIHGLLYSISANLDYFAVMLEKMENIGVDPFFIKYNASKYYIVSTQLHAIDFLKDSTLNKLSKYAESDV
ncbi:hypothetical protein AB6D11_27760 [Vibrio splendidus]